MTSRRPPSRSIELDTFALTGMLPVRSASISTGTALMTRPPGLPETLFVKEANMLEVDWRAYLKTPKKRFISPIKTQIATQQPEIVLPQLESRRERILQFMESPENVEHDSVDLVTIMRRIDKVNGKLDKDPELREFYRHWERIAGLPEGERPFAQIEARSWLVANKGDEIERELEQLFENCQRLSSSSLSPSSAEVQPLIVVFHELGWRLKKFQAEYEGRVQVTKDFLGEPEFQCDSIEPLSEMEFTIRRTRSGLERVEIPEASDDGKSKQSAAQHQRKRSRGLSLSGLLGALRKPKAIEYTGPPDLYAGVEKLIQSCSDWHEEWEGSAQEFEQDQSRLVGSTLDSDLESDRKELVGQIKGLQQELEREGEYVAGQRLLYRASDFLLQTWKQDRRRSFGTTSRRSSEGPKKPSAEDIVILKYIRREYTQASIVNLLCDKDHMSLPGAAAAARVFRNKLHGKPAMQSHDQRVAAYPLQRFKIQDMAGSDADALDTRMKELVCALHREYDELGRNIDRSDRIRLVVDRLQMAQTLVVKKMAEGIGLMEAFDELAAKQEEIRANAPIPIEGFGKAYAKEVLGEMKFEYPDGDFTF
ncbi:uncharacterized protein LTR77_005538 [Saxophila tyrrhenica]|uniref:Uncharacterized protein n=1 Tax=Saxophila tyrrhenica TaxID=1690608 RepID=A0AAV9PCT6_9PEZI|nr:hypothetical protein LTR77_005538 [Saxophila tyrrhenica]